MRQPLIAGNWKMNGTRESVDHLLKCIKARAGEIVTAELAVFPSYVFLQAAQDILSDTTVVWGAQNVSRKENGAFTGEISTSMLIDLGCQYVIVGHSERRTIYRESNEQVAEKFMKALQAGLRPVLCVGESLEQREADITMQVIYDQLDAVFTLTDNHASLAQAVVAYEPIWAIGTGRQATPEQAQEVHLAIRDHCRKRDQGLGDSIRILYGGSVKPENAGGLLGMPDIDGALVGGASLDADKFIEIALCSS